MKPYKLPTLQCILGDFCYLLPSGTKFQAGDRWGNGDGLTALREALVDECTMELGGLYRPVEIPYGLRIRHLFERAQTGDLSGIITNGVLDVDPHGDGPLPALARENGMSVREICSQPVTRAQFPGDDFVVLTPTHKPTEAVEDRWTELALRKELHRLQEANDKLRAAALGNAVLVRKDGFMRPAFVEGGPRYLYNSSRECSMERFERTTKTDAFSRVLYNEVSS